jgi:chromatin segregation and condensation protein Rec8/ScpA/Scc1 (kleisin family)
MLSYLLALLEMARTGELLLFQAVPFSDMEIKRDVAGEAA